LKEEGREKVRDINVPEGKRRSKTSLVSGNDRTWKKAVVLLLKTHGGSGGS